MACRRSTRLGKRELKTSGDRTSRAHHCQVTEGLTVSRKYKVAEWVCRGSSGGEDRILRREYGKKIREITGEEIRAQALQRVCNCLPIASCLFCRARLPGAVFFLFIAGYFPDWSTRNTKGNSNKGSTLEVKIVSRIARCVYIFRRVYVSASSERNVKT